MIFVVLSVPYLRLRCKLVFMILISVRTMTVTFATASSIILFISFFPSVLVDTFSIAFTVFAKAVVTLLNSNLVSSSFEG